MRTLVNYLNQRSPQELRVIAERWEANQTERLLPGQTFELSQEMSNEFLQRRLLSKLSQTELLTLQFFTRQENYTSSWENVAAELQIPGSATLNTLHVLERAGLLFADKVRETDAPVARPWGGTRTGSATSKQIVWVLPRDLARSLRRLLDEKLEQGESPLKISQLPLRLLLNRLEPEVLESVAETWGLVALLGSGDVAAIADELARVLSDQATQEQMLSQLDDEARLLFERLKQKTTIASLLETYVSVQRLGRNLRPLTERLLAWEAFEGNQSIVFVPTEIRKPTHNDIVISTLALQTVTEPPQNVTPYPAYALAWDILTFLNYLGQNEVVLTNQHYIPKRHVKKMMDLMWPSSEERFNFMQQMAERLRLYVIEDGRLLPTGPGLNEWLKLDFYAQLHRLFDAFMSNPYTSVVYFPYYYNSRNVVVRTYETIMGWLSQCQPEIWYSMASLLKKIQTEEPFFIRSRRDLLNQFGAQQVEETSRQWLLFEAETVKRIFENIFEWLGIVQISRNDAGDIQDFRLTTIGQQLLPGESSGEPLSLPRIEKPLLVQPNFEVMLLAPQVETLWSLLKFSYQRKLDLVSIFALDRLSVLRGLETGFTTAAILEWLEARSPQALPQNIQVSVRDWGKDFKRVTLEQTILLETENPQVLDELMRSPKYAEYFVRRIAPTAAIIKMPTPNPSSAVVPRLHDQIKSFRNLLKKDGFFASQV